MDLSVVPVYNLMNDYVSNYTTGNVDVNQRLRAINVAIAEVHRMLGLTCDETIFNFLYTQDNMYTSLPTDFDEPIVLVYENNKYNVGGQAGWQWNQYTRILQNSAAGGYGSGTGYGFGYALGRYGQKWFSSTNINGSKQLIQLGPNVIQGGTVNVFNSLNLVSGTGDATNLAVDNNFYVNGGGSVSFTIDPTLGNGYAGIMVSGFGIMTVEQAIQNSAFYKVYSWLQTTAISNINLVINCTGGTFTFSATTQDNGDAFISGDWMRTSYEWNLVSITGNPNAQEVTSYEFRYFEGAGFGTVAIPFFRINNFYQVVPDSMNLVYYSQYKGTDSTGMVKKIILTELTDLPTFMQFFPDFINMIALRAAVILMPQLSGDKDFLSMYKNDYLEVMKDLGRIYPRKRAVNLGQTMLRRP